MDMNDKTKTDPLEKLFKDSSTIQAEQREKLANLLEPYVILSKDKDSKLMNFKQNFISLINVNKVEVVFLAEKARALYLNDEKNEGLGQTDLIALKIMPAGSVKSSLNKLSKDKYVIQNAKGKYMLPNYRLPDLFMKYSGGNVNEK